MIRSCESSTLLWLFAVREYRFLIFLLEVEFNAFFSCVSFRLINPGIFPLHRSSLFRLFGVQILPFPCESSSRRVGIPFDGVFCKSTGGVFLSQLFMLLNCLVRFLSKLYILTVPSLGRFRHDWCDLSSHSDFAFSHCLFLL